MNDMVFAGGKRSKRGGQRGGEGKGDGRKQDNDKWGRMWQFIALK
jgi:hypothetical protein